MTQTVTYVGLLTDIVSRDGRMVARVGEGQSGMGKGGGEKDCSPAMVFFCISFFLQTDGLCGNPAGQKMHCYAWPLLSGVEYGNQLSRSASEF